MFTLKSSVPWELVLVCLPGLSVFFLCKCNTSTVLLIGLNPLSGDIFLFFRLVFLFLSYNFVNFFPSVLV